MTLDEGQRKVLHQVCSLLLRYPDAELRAVLPAVDEAVLDLPAEVREPLSRLSTHVASGDPVELAATYSETFDFARRCSLYLTYYSFGDTRQRGAALLRFTSAYRTAGLELDSGELPDYLPMVLEFAALGDAAAGTGLLASHRAALDVLHDALVESGSPYRLAVDAVRRSLPPRSARDAVLADRPRANGPPTEDVGLEPYSLDPALLSGSR